MELDHQQMAGASSEKPITAVVPGIRGDSSEVTACELHLFKSCHARLHPFGSFIGFFLFVFNSLLTSGAVPQSSICCCSRQAGRRRKSERGTGAASDGSMGIGNTWHSAHQEVPPVTATLAKKCRSKFKFIAKQRDPFRGELLKKNWRRKPFTAEYGAPAAELDFSEYLPRVNRA